jgi:hypothetical protein
MVMKRGVRGGLALLLIVVFLMSSAPVKAANTGFNVITSPPNVRLQTDPGKTVTTELRIKNTSPETETIKVGLMKFGAAGEEGRPNIADRQPGDDYFDWVSFSPNKFEAPSNQWMTVKMTFTVPENAQLGYYYAVTFSRDQEVAQENKSVLVGSTATLVLLDVKTPNAKRTLQLKDFTLDRKSYEFLPVTFSMHIQNTGNIHLAPVGNVFINQGKKQIATLNVNQAGGLILPNSSRGFSVDWNDGFPVYKEKSEQDKPVIGKDGKTQKSLVWDFAHLSKLRFGKFTAHLLIVYNDGEHDVPLEAEATFWVIPWRIIVSLLLLVLLIIAGIWAVTRGSFRKLKKIKLKKFTHEA